MIDGIPYKDLTFDQFATWATRLLLDALITQGMAGVKQKLYIILPRYIEYHNVRKNAD